MMAILFVTVRPISLVIQVDILTTQKRQLYQFSLLVSIVWGKILMQSQRRQTYYFSFAKFVFIGKPYRITANKILVEKIDVVCGQAHLGCSITVCQKDFQEISQQFIMNTCLHFINGYKPIGL